MFNVVNKYCEEIEGKVKPLLAKKEPLSESDMEKFGKKDPEAYPEYFPLPLLSFSVFDSSYPFPLSLSHFLPLCLLALPSCSLPSLITSLYSTLRVCLISLTPSLTEVERFIEMNTEKITENKYLCPLSGKKFKGPEFVRKHIFNKHMEKVNAVKQEVSVYLNTVNFTSFSKSAQLSCMYL